MLVVVFNYRLDERVIPLSASPPLDFHSFFFGFGFANQSLVFNCCVTQSFLSGNENAG